ASNKTVTVTGVALSGPQAGNYVLPSTTATTTASITPAPTTISLSNLEQAYDGTQKSVSATPSLTICAPVAVTYNPAPPINVGSYAVSAVPNPNCTGSAMGTLIISASPSGGA